MCPCSTTRDFGVDAAALTCPPDKRAGSKTRSGWRSSYFADYGPNALSTKGGAIGVDATRAAPVVPVHWQDVCQIGDR